MKIIFLCFALLVSVAASAQNLNDTTPAAATGGVNIKFQFDGSSPHNVSAYVPAGFFAQISGSYTLGDCVSWSLTIHVLGDAGSPCQPFLGNKACNGTEKVSSFDSSGNPVCTADQTGSVGTGITSLNGLTVSSQTFAAVGDTNLSLNITSAGSVHTYTVAWAGTLAKARQFATTVYADQANTYGLFLQDFSGAKMKLPHVIVATLPAAGASNGLDFVVTDGVTTSDCTVGGGSSRALCESNGAAWLPLGGSAGGSGAINAGTQYQVAYYPGAGTTLSPHPNWLTNANGDLILGAAKSLKFNTCALTETGGNLATACPLQSTATGANSLTEIAAPITPAATQLDTWADSADHRFHDLNSSGVMATTVVPLAPVAHNFVTGIGINGVVPKAQPACADLSDATLCNATSTLSGDWSGTYPGGINLGLNGAAPPASADITGTNSLRQIVSKATTGTGAAVEANGATVSGMTCTGGCTGFGAGGGGQVNFPFQYPIRVEPIGLSITAANTVANTVTATSIVGKTFQGRNYVPAGAMLVNAPGPKTARLHATGTLGTAGSLPTLSLTVSLGGQTLSTISVPLITSLSADGWELDYSITVTGLTTATVGGCVHVIGTSGAELMGCGSNANVTGLNFAAQQALDVQATWGTASASNTITANQLSVSISQSL